VVGTQGVDGDQEDVGGRAVAAGEGEEKKRT
jgi:hypothetical protein